MKYIIAFFTALVFSGCAGLIQKGGCGKEVACAYAHCTESGCELFAQNTNNYPITLAIKLKTEGLHHKKYDDEIFVIDPNKKSKIGTLRYNGFSNRISVNIHSEYTKGSYKSLHESEHLYRLPYGKNKKYLVGQGYNGSVTHINQWKYSVDFNMPIGDTICAAREGTVIEIKEDGDHGCPSKECDKDGNYVSIIHSDGTIAQYAHIQKNGALIHLGDTATKGMPIALSGATGYATGPHLHFMVTKPTGAFDYETIPTKFMTKNGVLKELIQNQEYTAQ